MGVLTGRRVLLAVALLLIFAFTLFVGLWFGLTADDAAPPAECVRCFARFNLSLGQCDEELSEVDKEICCQNPQHGYQATDGVCRSCGPPLWSPWSPWSQCNVLCEDGVMQRTRKCYGAGQCENAADALQMQPCNSSCCDVQGWGSWLTWSSCSVTCGGGGVRRRERVCSGPPECRSACSGPSEETETCPTNRTCPVDGVWGSWSSLSSCSVTCGVGLQEWIRLCDSPAPKHGGQPCPGEGRRTNICTTNVHCPECVRCFARFNLSLGQCDEELGEVAEDICCQNPQYGYQATDGVCRPCGPPLWSPWSPWSQCNVLCGDGVMQRTRKCYGAGKCQNATDALQTQPCNGSCCDECVRCFARFDRILGQCDEELGEVDKDICCQNPQYGYQATDGVCRSCGPPLWSPWSPWSQCNVLCGDGVMQRTRKCYGAGECQNAEDALQMQPCNSSCCDVQGWGSWLAWSSCSVTCGGGGVRRRERVCSGPPECRSACSGPSEETETCPTHSTCPVHGVWSSWSCWSGLNDQSDDVIVPSRKRHRSCSKPAPSNDTVPPGNRCPGDDVQVQDCSELPNCPSETMSKSGWSSWGECSSSCIPQGHAPVRTRHRSCTNPAPSSSPPGRRCEGVDRQTETCDHLPHCPVDGVWGSWSSFTSCPVTCGVGLQESIRLCDSPAPKHGGQPCPGEGRRTNICTTNVHCPVDGMWSQWSPWKPCMHPFGGRSINCQQIGGKQTRERECLHQAHNGSICSGDALTELRVCYDVERCYLKGTWAGWESWSLCSPTCGEKSRRIRKRYCKPDYSSYRSTIRGFPAAFFGTPKADCGDPPDGGKKFEIQRCINAPSCP